MQPFKHIFILTILCFIVSLQNIQSCNKSLFICYGKIDLNRIQGYKYVIIEPDLYGAKEIELLKQQNEYIIGYVSIGEVNATASYFSKLQPYTKAKNLNWNSYYIDLRNSRVNKILLQEINRRVEMGLDGLFLDNIDTFSAFGYYPNQQNLLVQLIKSIHTQHSKLQLIQNSGLSLLTQTQRWISAIAIESTITDYNFSSKTYKIRTHHERKERLTKLIKQTEKYAKEVFLIEYADTKELYQKIHRYIPNKDWGYFIGEINLQTIPVYCTL